MLAESANPNCLGLLELHTCNAKKKEGLVAVGLVGPLPKDMNSVFSCGTLVERAKTGAVESEQIYPCYTPAPR